jgi:beta-lactamase class D
MPEEIQLKLTYTILLPVLWLAAVSIGFCSEQETEAPLSFETQSSPELSKLFNEAGVSGTFVLYDVSAECFTIHDQARAETRFIPASTFKVPNSLIGLSTGVVSDVEELIPYGGKPQFLKVWEQDMGLRDAIKVSNVPVYQELARRIGLERMNDYLALMNYGNKNTGTVVDMFWLQGPLKISAVEQSKFLARLALGELRLSADVQQSVREIIRVDQGDDWVLYAKTGWTTTPTPDIGWWVGWVVKDERIFSFALNIDMVDKGDAAKRMDLGKASLKLLGLIK